MVPPLLLVRVELAVRLDQRQRHCEAYSPPRAAQVAQPALLTQRVAAVVLARRMAPAAQVAVPYQDHRAVVAAAGVGLAGLAAAAAG